MGEQREMFLAPLLLWLDTHLDVRLVAPLPRGSPPYCSGAIVLMTCS